MPVKKKSKTKAAPAPARKRARVKAGTSKTEAAHRKILFARAFLANNGNKTQAAVTAGYKPGRGAELAGYRLSKDVVVQAIIAEEHKKASHAAGLSVEKTLIELARMAYSDPAKFFKKGKLLDIENMDPDARGALAEFEIKEVLEGDGKKKTVAGFIKKIKLWDKNSAIEKAMKFHKLYSDTPPPASVGTVIVVQAGRYDEQI